MNKTAIKNFAIWARRKLIADITYKAGLIGISEKGIASPLPQSKKDLQFFDIGTKSYAEVSGKEVSQRDALVSAIKCREKTSDYKTAFRSVIEEVAYTWFNRLIAVRFMEVNDYLPSRVRVLSSETPKKNEPDFVTTPFDMDLDFSSYERDRVMQLKDENKLDELFRMLFIKQCNKLNEILPELFEKTADYSELLLTISFTDKDGVVYHLTHDISEDDFNVSKEGQVEIIGWMYQYYISEKHDEIINIYKGTIKKDDIPAATQLFTTDWVVRYMVDNSLGRYWVERNSESKLAEKLEYFVTPKDGHINYINEKVQPQDLTFFDPCMGSGHILVYAFDVLMEIYRECGYSDRDAALNIVQNNLFGMDIDKRAYQLAYFAVMMKARSYNRRALTQGAFNNLAVIEESNSLSKFAYEGMTKDKEQNKIGEYLVDAFKHAREIGSLQTIEKKDYKAFAEYLLSIKTDSAQMDIFSSSWAMTTLPLMLQLTKQAFILSNKYAVVCTNPPYMNKLESHLKDFVVTNYKAYSGDLFSVFMYRNFGFCKQNGYSAFMTPFVWMFIKTYEALRNYIIDTKAITTLVQMEYSAFEEATVPICSFVLKNGKPTEPAYCFRLSDFKGGMEVQKQKVLEAQANKECGFFYESAQDNFSKIPGSPIAYWLSKNMIKHFAFDNVGSVLTTREGMATADNDRFLRLWFELKNQAIAFNCDDARGLVNPNVWVPYNKGGEFRKWYGNNDFVVYWENDGFAIKNNIDPKTNRIRSHNYNGEYAFRKGITWSALSSGSISIRYCDTGFLFDSKGAKGFSNQDDNLLYCQGLINSKVGLAYLKVLSPTIDFKVGDIILIPLIEQNEDLIINIVQSNIFISREDWDSFETSWDFVTHPLVQNCHGVHDKNGIEQAYIEDSYNEWEFDCNERFNTLKSNEEELNRIFIDIYGLQDELTPDVADKDVTVRKADLQRDIKSLISYAVGCMFGRYSLDADGLACAGGEWDSSKYTSFIPDADNCIPITDEDYFHDDIVGRFAEFIKTVYGADTLEENLDFIAKALGNKGNTSREIIRNYFLNDFIKDHIKIYQKRPIYWMFDSGKQNGFKSLVYMHRWNADTTGNVRVEYLHKVQKVYESEIVRMQDTIENSTNGRDVAAAEKRKEKLTKQLKEAKDYDAKIAHLALSRIDIDLDDGVKVNYEKVQTGQDGKKIAILTKI